MKNMKNITAKDYKGAFEFIAQIDRKSGWTSESFEYIGLHAKDAIEAMDEVENLFTDSVYMIEILRKDGKDEDADGFQTIRYIPVLATRTAGSYHKCDAAHSESSDYHVRYYANFDNERVTFQSCCEFIGHR